MRSRRGRNREGGQILVLFELSFIVFLALAAIVIDLGVLRNDRQILVNTMDSAALAGGSKLPVTGPAGATAANALIAESIQANYPGLPTSHYSITYKCLIGADSTGPLISRDVPLVCNPQHALGHTPVASDFIGAGSTRVSACDPTLGDTCNVVVVAGFATAPYDFGPALGVNSGSTGTVSSAACQGPCGLSPLTPVDVVLIMDRTSSMSGTDTENATTAANSIVSIYNPGNQWLGFSLLGPSTTSGSCVSAPASSIGTASFPTDLRRWVPVGLSGTGSAFSTTYAKVSAAINCYTNSSTGTDLADPITAAAYELAHNGRTGVRKGIIFETDGQPNAGVSGASSNYCNNASVAATAAKAAGIEIFTIGFGLDGSNDAACPDSSGAFKGEKATYLLASMATQPSSDSLGCPGTTTPNTNTDGDHFFCLPKTTGASTNLSSVFQAAASQLAKGGAHLVQLYPAPVVTGASGSTSVSISGEYFTGATSVAFGGAPATSFTVNSDTSITATAPARASGTIVDVIVTTPGGTSALTSADQYRYP
ncbi:MAG: VWA domain-containing protein [Candidatus Limnocylindrales bacterium]